MRARRSRERPGPKVIGLRSNAELQARRAQARRRARRRQRNLVAALVLCLLTIAAVATAGSRSGSHSAAATARPAKRSSPEPASATAVVTPPPAGAAPSALGATQSGPVDHVLTYTPYVQLAGHRQREVALTFDDGPSPYTPRILRVLVRLHTPATFFAMGQWARAYPGLIRAEVRAGAEIGDHTETHPSLSQLPPETQRAQILDAAHWIRAAGAPAPVLMRPPYGAFNPATLEVLRAARLLMVLWSVDTSDYERPGVDKILHTAVSGAQPGAIILMHDGGGDRSQTAAALPRIIARLRRRGYRLVTVSQLVRDDPPPLHQPPPQPLSGGI